MRLVCISDTHGFHEQMGSIPDGDLLIHAGDALGRGTLEELEQLDAWFGCQNHTHKILIAGNHDWCFEREPEQAKNVVTNAVYLRDSSVELDGVRFWGSPYTPAHLNWAFNKERGSDIAEHWDLIPQNTDVLITHGPPHGVLDMVCGRKRFFNVGCEDLWKRVQKLSLKAHIFGHIHECWGMCELMPRATPLFVNASICSERFKPVRSAVVIDI